MSRVFARATPMAGCALLLVAAASESAQANPRPLPFTYQYSTLAKGETELEQFVDFVPTRARAADSGEPVWFGASRFQTEFEYGITDRLELGLYVLWSPTATHVVEQPQISPGNGLKQRLRYRIADAGELPIDIALYGELTETDREFEVEAKLILERRIQNLRAIANLWVEREFYYDGSTEWVLHPTLGITYEASPTIQPGLEYWMAAEYPDQLGSPRSFALGPHHYLGPALLASFGKLWWSTGAYFRLSDTSYQLRPGDVWGKVWIRTVVGVAL